MKNRSFYISIMNAINGLKVAFKSEKNFRTEIYIAILTLILCFVFSLSTMEVIIIIICISLVLGSELLNSALEHLVDLASPEYHDLAKKTKDIGAGAVLILSIAAAIIGFMIFIPKILMLVWYVNRGELC